MKYPAGQQNTLSGSDISERHGGDKRMCWISFGIFLIAMFAFIGIMVRDPRALWSGFSLFWTLVCFALFAFILLSQYTDQLVEHDWFMGVLVFFFIVAILCACAFPGLIDNYIQMENSSKMNHTKILKLAVRHMVCFRILHFCNVPLPQILLRIQFV